VPQINAVSWPALLCSPTESGDENIQKVLVGKPEGKRPLVRARRRWEDTNRIDLRETGWWEGVD